MRPALQEAIDWWEADEERFNPFDTGEGSPYVVEDYLEAQEYEERATQAFATGAAEDDNGDQFELAAVFFALTLFFGGIAALFQSRRVTVALLGASGVVLVIGVVSLLLAL